MSMGRIVRLVSGELATAGLKCEVGSDFAERNNGMRARRGGERGDSTSSMAVVLVSLQPRKLERAFRVARCRKCERAETRNWFLAENKRRHV